MNERAAAAIARSVIAGALSGLRSASGPALAARELHERGPRRGDRLATRLLASEHATEVTGALAAGEVLADKHPSMPARTDTPALAGRAAAGAIAAVALVDRRAGTRVLFAHALIGAGAAIISTHLSYHARRKAVERSGAPDTVIAMAEDVLTYVGGALALRGAHRRAR